MCKVQVNKVEKRKITLLGDKRVSIYPLSLFSMKNEG